MSDLSIFTRTSPLTALFGNSGTIRTRRSIDNVAASDPAGAADLQAQQAPASPDLGDGSSISPALKAIYAMLGPATGTMASMVQDGADAGAFDTTDKFNAWLTAKTEAAKKAPSIYELQAQNALTDSKAAQALADYERANPTPKPSLLTAQQYPGVELPEVPTNVQSRPNGIASLGAGIAGLIAPQFAGRFAAEALQGAITANARENAVRQQQYQLKLQQSLLRHQDDIRQADAQAEVDAQNARTKNTFTAQEHSDNLKAAVDSLNAAKLRGEAGNLQAYGQQDREAKALDAQAEVLHADLQASIADAKDKQERALRAANGLSSLTEHMLTIQARQDALKQSAAKQAADQADKAEGRALQQKQINRQEAHDKATEDIQRSHLTIEQKNSALRALEIQYQHEDKGLDRQQRATSEGRQGTMLHETPQMKAAWTDIDLHKKDLQEAKKNYASSPGADTLKKRDDALIAYNRARQIYMDLGNKARADIDAHRLPGMPPPVLSGPGFSLTPR